MTSETCLLVANISVWAGIAAYIAFIAARGASLERRIRQLEVLDDER